jgi:pimeloyl-ACP methyl ester carboxylesterase
MKRIVTYGFQAGGAMGLLVAFQHRDLVRGVAAVDAPLPRTRPPDNDPLQRLAVYLALPEESEVRDRIRNSAKLLSEMKYPVTVRTLSGKPRPLDGGELAELLRWVDTLDRL